MRVVHIIDAIGGYREVAREIDLDPTTVFKWLKNGIPSSHYPKIRDMAKAKGIEGITLEVLYASRP